MSDQELNQATPNADESSAINETSAQETVSTHEVVPETTLTEPVAISAETVEVPTENVEKPAETVAESSIPATVEIEQDTSAADKRKEEKEKRKQLEEEQAAMTDAIHADQSVIEATVAERIKGGLRLDYNGARLFMPASHFGLKRAPSDKELTDAVGTTIPVQIIEIQKDENGRRTVVASRRKLLRDSFFGCQISINNSNFFTIHFFN
jgi:ribosomal protein S1